MDAKRGLHPALALMAATMLVAALASLLLKGAFKEGLRPRFSLLMVGPAVAGEQGLEAGLLLEVRRCAFGRWYFSSERREMAAGYLEIQPLLAELGALHLEMHCSARMIRAFLSRGDRPAALAYHQEYAAPALERLVSILREMEAQTPRLCRREPDLAACTQRFAVLFANFGGVLCGCYSFGDACDARAEKKPEPRAAFTAAPNPG